MYALYREDGTIYATDTNANGLAIAIPDDFNGDIYEMVVKDGELTTPVPKSISPAQIRLQLTTEGLRATVETAVAASADYDLKDWWEYSLEYDRYNPLLIEFAASLGLTEEQLDEMFIAASKL